MAKVHITAVIIAKNEAARIAQCIDSVSWASEILVIDNSSTDDTRHIASRMGAHVYSTSTTNFSELRMLGQKKAAGDWILYVDADEIITPSLKKEIISTVETAPEKIGGYFIRRTNYYLGVQWPGYDKMQRLFRVKSLRKWNGIVHESAEILGDYSELIQPLLHRTHRTLEEMVDKTNSWSIYEASLRFDSHHPKVAFWRILRVMIPEFIHSYVQKKGYTVGGEGLIEALFQAYSIGITYMKLWERQVLHAT